MQNGDLEVYGETDNGGKFKWSWAWKTFRSVVPQSSRDRVVLIIDTIGWDGAEHREDGAVIDDRGWEAHPLERIVWCIDENGGGDYKRFFTEYYPTTASELKEFVKEETRRRRKAGIGVAR